MQNSLYSFRVTAATTSRRELNKARTRERLLEALRAQLRTGSSETMTVETVAEAAGVSRRTFFNYFTSLESALAEGMSVPIAGLAEAFVERPLEEDPLVAMDRALQTQPIPRDLLTWIVAVKCSGLERHNVAVNVWSYHLDWFEGILRERLPHADDFAVTSLAGTVMAIFQAAERQWVQHPVDDVDEVAAADFNRLLRQGLHLAQTGWVIDPDAAQPTGRDAAQPTGPDTSPTA